MSNFSTDISDDKFESIMSLSEKAERHDAERANQAFAAAMNREIKRGRIKATAGTFVDTSPAIYAHRVRGDVALSFCGSPAALCMESSGSGTQSLK